jgi:hypothetical protein
VFNLSSIHLKPSLWLTVLFTAIAIATAGALYLINLPWPVFLFSLMLILIYYIYTLGHYAWVMWPTSINSVFTQLDADGKIVMEIRNNNGLWNKVRVQADTLITPTLTVLIVKTPTRSLWTKKILLTKDNCDRNQFRKFRVLARMASQ